MWSTASGGQKKEVEQSYERNCGSMSSGWPPELSVTRSQARRFCRDSLQEVTGLNRGGPRVILVMRDFVCIRLELCICDEITSSVKHCLWRSFRTHRTTVYIVTLVRNNGQSNRSLWAAFLENYSTLQWNSIDVLELLDEHYVLSRYFYYPNYS